MKSNGSFIATAAWGCLVACIAFLSSSCSSVPVIERVTASRDALCSSTTLSTAPPSPIAPGGQVTLAATASCNGATAEFLFAYQWPSNPSHVVTIQNWSTQASVLWDTAAVPPGNYVVNVYSRTLGNTNSESSASIGSFMIGSVCSAVTLSASPPVPAGGALPLGTQVNLSASATCNGATPEYQFYYIPPGTANYVQIGAAGSWGGASAALSTAGLGSGLYSFYVRARGVGNQASNYESQAYTSNYALGAVCLNAHLSAVPASPQLPGTAITLSASSTCVNGATAQYHFLYKESAETSYHDVQSGYDGSSTVWNTTGLSPSTYQVQVYARGTGNASIAEGYDIANYLISPQLTLSAGGVAKMNIVHRTGASQYTVDAANELKKYLDLITGANFTIVPNGTVSTPGILVGTFENDFATLPLASQLPTATATNWADIDHTYKEAYVVQIAPPSQLWLIGKTDVAVSHAVTRFLQQLGCRWFFQGSNWEVVSTAPGGNLSYSGDPIVDKPAMVYRGLSGLAMSDPSDGPGNVRNGDDEDAWRRRNFLAYAALGNNSLNLAFAQVSWSGASDNAFIPYTNKNPNDPNWFNFGGSTPPDDSTHPPPYNRYGWLTPSNPHKTIEVGNPEVLAKYWTWQTAYVIPASRWTSIDATSVEPGDGYAQIGTQNSISSAPDDGNDSDQMGVLATDVAQRLAASSDPTLNRKYVTMLGGYSHSVPPRAQLAPNVYVAAMDYEGAAIGGFEDFNALLDGWYNKGAKLAVWHNLSFPSGLSNLGNHYSQTISGSSPDYPSDSVALARSFTGYAAHHVTAAVFESTDDFGAHGLGYYLASKLMWNPNADVSSIRQDFFTLAFGPAAQDMRGYYDLLDPKDHPLLFDKDLMSRLYALLASASANAGGDPKVLARINDLKAYMHHNALWWQIYRADHNSQTQMQLVKDLLAWDYRTRWSYMNAFNNDLSIVVPAASQQFGASPDWQTGPEVSWRANGAALSQTEIDAAFTADESYFAPAAPFGPGSPVQVTFTGDPVGVTFPGPSQPLGLNDGSKPVQIALYTSGASTSVSLMVNVGQNSDRTRPAPPAVVTLMDGTNNQVVGTRTVPAGPQGNTAFINVTFTGLKNQTGYIATVNGYGASTWITNPFDTPMAQVLDQVYRANISCPATGLFFYVPKGTLTVQYTWNRGQLTFGGDALAMPIVPHRMWACKGPDYSTCGTQTPSSNLEAISYKGSTSITSYSEPLAVTVPPGDDGKLWYVTGLEASQLWFYNVPNYVSDSPSAMMVPRDVANRDHLALR